VKTKLSDAEQAAQRYISGYGVTEEEKPSEPVRAIQQRPQKKGKLKYLIIIIVVVVVVVVINPFDLNFMVTHKDNIYATEANGFSMEPTIECGSIVVVQAKDDPDFSLAVGDILVFLYPLHPNINSLSDIHSEDDYLVVGHTILEFQDDQILCKGDNNMYADSLVSDWQIVGKIVIITPRYNLLKRAVIAAIVGGNDNVIS
jgi:signal peptidase I